MNSLIKKIITSESYISFCRITFTALFLLLIQAFWVTIGAMENNVKKVVSLPMRLVTQSEYEAGKKEIEKLKAQIANDPDPMPRL